MSKVINISSNGIKQAIDDLVNENELLQDKVYKQEDEIQRLNNIMDELEKWLNNKYKKYSENFISNIVDEFDIYFDSNLTDFDKTAIIIDIVRKMDKESLNKLKELKEGSDKEC